MSDILEERMRAVTDLRYEGDWRDVQRRARRAGKRPIRPLLAAAVAGAAVAAAPALAFSTSVQQLVGLRKPSPRASTGWTHPQLVARVTNMSYHRLSRYGLPLVTVTFTVGEAGKAPGTGITFGSYFLVDVERKTGEPFLSTVFLRASGSHGHYTVTVPVPPGGIGSIRIAGLINHPTGPSAANGTFWIPVVIPVQGH